MVMDDYLKVHALETFFEFNEEDVFNQDDETRLSIEGYKSDRRHRRSMPTDGHDFDDVGYSQTTPVDKAIRDNGRSVFITRA